MTIPKKGSRKIVVDNVEYRWRIRSNPTYTQGAFGDNMTAAVELYQEPKSVLIISFPWMRCDNWLGDPISPVTPKHIEASIRQAIIEGWQPNIKGSAFRFNHKIKE